MSQPQQAQRYQTAGFIVLAVGVVILIGGAIAQSTGLTVVAWSVVAIGLVLYIGGRYGTSRTPRQRRDPGVDTPAPSRSTDPRDELGT